MTSLNQIGMDYARSASSESSDMAFPSDPSEFANDSRISYSQLDNTYLLETGNGQEFLWDTGLKRWIMQVDEELIRQQQSGYTFEGVDETEVVHPRELKKRKKAADESDAPKVKKPRVKVNKAVWVTKIPLDAQKDEIRERFAKFGVIAENEMGEARIKMYEDEAGKFKGEALVVYFRPESVDLAINMLDETDFRLGVSDPAGPMRVEVADSSYKTHQPDDQEKPKLSLKDKRKMTEQNERLNRKLTDWDDDDIAPVIKKPTQYEKIVILKHMFTLKELEEDPAALLDIKEEIRDECATIGEVTNVVLYDKEPEGVVTVRFKDPADALTCVEKLAGRRFSGIPVEAYISPTRQKFQKTDNRREYLDGAADSADEDEDEEERLERFGDWLEGGNATSK